MASPFALMITRVALAGVTAFAQMGALEAQAQHQNAMLQHQYDVAQAQYEANAKQLEYLSRDVSRRKDETRTEYQEAYSDRVMKANQEIAMASLLAEQRGVVGSTMQSMVRHLATVEGVDLSRIRGTRDSKLAALDSELEAGIINYNQNNKTAHNQSIAARNQTKTNLAGISAQRTNTLLNTVGSGLQIYTGYRRDKAQMGTLQNTI